MRQRKNESRSTSGAEASMLAQIDQLLVQIAARDARIAELLAQVTALNPRIAELEAKLGAPPKTPDNSSLLPSRSQKGNAEPPAIKPQRKGRPGVARQLVENPDATRRLYAERCACGAVLDAAGQYLANEYDHIDIPPIRPVVTPPARSRRGHHCRASAPPPTATAAAARMQADQCRGPKAQRCGVS
jgi:hypothetical protein